MDRHAWLDSLKIADEVIVVNPQPMCHEKSVGRVYKINKRHIVVSIGDLKYNIDKDTGSEPYRRNQFWPVCIEEPTDELRKEIRIANKVRTVNRLLDSAMKSSKDWREEDLDAVKAILDKLQKPKETPP